MAVRWGPSPPQMERGSPRGEQNWLPWGGREQPPLWKGWLSWVPCMEGEPAQGNIRAEAAVPWLGGQMGPGCPVWRWADQEVPFWGALHGGAASSMAVRWGLGCPMCRGQRGAPESPRHGWLNLDGEGAPRCPRPAWALSPARQPVLQQRVLPGSSQPEAPRCPLGHTCVAAGGCRVSLRPPACRWHQVRVRAVCLAGRCYSKNKTDSKIWAFLGARGFTRDLPATRQLLVVTMGDPGVWGP